MHIVQEFEIGDLVRITGLGWENYDDVAMGQIVLIIKTTREYSTFLIQGESEEYRSDFWYNDDIGYDYRGTLIQKAIK